MNTEQQDFDRLLRLLKLKRYEQPPPRYFNDFSSQVIDRIKSGGRERMDVPWFQRLLEALDAKAAFAWMFGLAACALVVSGIVYSEAVDYPQVNMLPEQSALPVSIETAQVPEQTITAPPISLSQPVNGGLIAFTPDTNSIVPRNDSLFNLIQPVTEPVSWKLGDD